MDNTEQEAPIIYWRIDEWFPDLSPDIKARLKSYHDELIKFNRITSLISGKTIFVADALYFADGIFVARTIMTANSSIKKIYNMAAGAGFSGLILALLYPQVHVVLLEGDLKKVEFLRHIIKLLNINNAAIESKAIDTYSEGSIEFAMGRGTMTISKIILMCRKVVPKGGAFFHLKGEEWGIEVGEIPSQLCSVWMPSLVGEYKLPVGTMKFSIVKTEKIA